MDYPENRNSLPLADTVSVPPKTQSDSSDPRDATALYTNVDRRRFLRVSGLAAGAALAGTVALRQAEAIGAVTGHHDGEISPPVTGAALKTRKKTLFGIGYETWYIPSIGGGGWGTAEAMPVLGHYSSMDSKVIRQHAQWIYDAGFDFILIDWSNNLGGNWTNGVAEGIIGSTLRLLAEYTHLKRRPKFALLLGLDNGSCATSAFHKQIQRIEREILAKPEYASLWQHFDGKPLLGIFPEPSVGTPPAYLAPHFTVRFMGAFHEITLNPGGAWSWVDRVPIVNGSTTPIFPFQDQSLRPWKVGAGWSLAHQANMGAYATCPKGTGGALVSPPFTVTHRTITFNYSGVDYWVYSRLPFPGGKIPGGEDLFVLRDAATGAVLRRAFPPGMSQFTMRQWDVGDLIGRQVIFEAMAGSAAGLPYGGSMSFGGLAFTRNEQIVASVALGGNEAGGGAWLDWDAHLRCSGATLVQFMAAAFRYEPEVIMIQQWNEFGAPDQYSVEGSNDIEPTIIHRLDGPYSDGWGYYYLDLVTKLIRQYRQGFRTPQVLLNTRYP
ncbi:MAG: hypothetical protein ACP5I8_13405 [Phycisphaerae bacterium]